MRRHRYETFGAKQSNNELFLDISCGIALMEENMLDEARRRLRRALEN